METLNKDETYNKYKEGKSADFIFGYILREYHIQPNDFIKTSFNIEDAETALKRATENTDKEFAKQIIDDYFCDVLKKKRGRMSSWY